MGQPRGSWIRLRRKFRPPWRGASKRKVVPPRGGEEGDPAGEDPPPCPGGEDTEAEEIKKKLRQSEEEAARLRKQLAEQEGKRRKGANGQAIQGANATGSDEQDELARETGKAKEAARKAKEEALVAAGLGEPMQEG